MNDWMPVNNPMWRPSDKQSKELTHCVDTIYLICEAVARRRVVSQKFYHGSTPRPDQIALQDETYADLEKRAYVLTEDLRRDIKRLLS